MSSEDGGEFENKLCNNCGMTYLDWEPCEINFNNRENYPNKFKNKAFILYCLFNRLNRQYMIEIPEDIKFLLITYISKNWIKNCDFEDENDWEPSWDIWG